MSIGDSEVLTAAEAPAKGKSKGKSKPEKEPGKVKPKKAAPPKKAPAKPKAATSTAKASADDQSERADYHKIATKMKTVADATRVHIVKILGGGERHVGGLCDTLRISSQPAVSHHLAILRHCGVVRSRREGKNNFYSLTQVGDLLHNMVKTLE